MSADALLVSAVAADALIHKPVDVAHHESAVGQQNFHDSLHYNPAAETAGVFDGVSAQPISSSETATATHSGSQNQSAPVQNSDSATQAKSEAKTVTVSSASSAKILTPSATVSAASASASSNPMTQQLTASLTASNGPPANSNVSQNASNQSVNKNSSSSNSSNGGLLSSTVPHDSDSNPIDLLQSISDDLQAIGSGSTPSPIDLGDATLAGILSAQGVKLSFAGLTISGGTVTAGTVTVTATSASINLGAFTASLGAINGTYDIASKTFLLTLNSVSVNFSSFVNISADSMNLTYHSSSDATVNVTDGTNTTTASVSVLTLGINNATVFAGLNGPSSNSDAVGVELDGANLALALMSTTDGTVYYGVEATAGSLSVHGLPDGFHLDSTDLQILVNGSTDGSSAVNFDSSFTSATSANGKGLDVSTGSGTVNLDYTGQLLQAAGTIDLSFNGFVYIDGSMAIQSQASTSVTLTDGTNTTTKTVSELTIGADSVTIFAGINGPSTNSDAVGVELDNASFALALFTGTDDKVYYGVTASATSLSGVGLPSDITVGAGDLDVQINGSNDGNNVVDFQASFGSDGLAVNTGPTTTANLDFTGSLLRVAGSLDLGVSDYIHISGGFSFTQTPDEIDINVGHTAFDGAEDLSFIVGSESSPVFSATGFLSMTITSSALTISDASMTIDSLKIGSVLEADSLTVSISNLSIDLASGDVSGVTDANGIHDPVLTVTVASASLFPDSTTFTGSVSATDGGDGLGFQGAFDLSTGAFSITLEQFHLAIGSVFTADASDVLVTYNPEDANPHQQLVQIGDATLDFKFGGNDITGNVTNLTIYKDGFHFDSVTIADGTTANPVTISLGSILSITNPSVTLTDFGVTFGSSVSANGSLTVTAANASLDVGTAFTASATNLSITIALDPDNLGNTTVTAGTLSLQFGSIVSFNATDVSINTDPADGGAYFSVGTATASLTIGRVLSATGTATNFSLIKSGSDVQLREDTGFSVSITVTPGQLNLPTWLGFQIQKFEVTWADFASHPDQFQLTLSASINSISGLPGGVTVSGEITDAVIDTAKLEAGEFPITSIGSAGGSISGTLFGMNVTADFIMGVVNFNADNGVVNADGSVTNSDGTVTDAGSATTEQTTVTGSTMYVGVQGSAEIPDLGTVSISIGFSSLGPLSIYLSWQAPVGNPEAQLILDPESGIAISGFSGGLAFNTTIQTPTVATDLPGVLSSTLLAVTGSTTGSPTDVDLAKWQQQLELETVAQYTATGGGTNLAAEYSQPFVILATVTLDDAYLSSDAFQIKGTMALGINPGATAGQPPVTMLISGSVQLGGSSGFSGATGYLYASFTSSSASLMFLVQEPGGGTPIEEFGGSLTFSFTQDGNPWNQNDSGNPDGFDLTLSGFFEYSALGFADVKIEGTVTLSVTPNQATIDLAGDVNVSLLGDLGDATGEFVLLYNGSTYQATDAVTTPAVPATTSFTNNSGSVEIFGALELSTGAAFNKLETYGLSVDGAALFQINTTGNDVRVNLPPTPSELNTNPDAPATPFVIQGSVIFDMTITGTSSAYATISYEVGGDTMFQMQGFFDVRLTNDPTNGLGLQMFADINTLTMGPSSSPFLSFSGFGLFVINSQGLAAEINLNLKAGNEISGISFTANFNLVINTTSQAVTFDIPSVTVPTSSSGSTAVAGLTIYDSNNNALPDLATSVVIPAGPPQGLLTETQINGVWTANYATVGPAGPYVVVSGSGSLTLEGLTLSGYFYFQMSDSPQTGFTLVLAVDVNGNIDGVGQAEVTGALQISNAGEVALLSVSGSSSGSPTDYGSGITFQINAQLGINTTDQDVSDIGGITLSAPILKNSWKVVASGTLTLSVGGTGFVINGVFSITTTHSDDGQSDDVTSTTIQAGGTLTATVGGSALLTMQVSGVLSISYTTTDGTSSAAVYGALVLTASGGNPLSGSGFSFDGSFLLEVNTTGAVQNPVDVNNDPLMFDGSSVVLAKGANGSSTAGDYVQIFAVGTLTFGTASNGFVLVADPNVDSTTQGLFLSISDSGLAISVGAKLSITVGGSNLLTVSASGAMEITSSGLAASITLTVSGGFNSSDAFSFSGSFVFQINTTGQAINDTIDGVSINIPAGPYFQIAIGTATSPATLTLGSSSSGLQLSGTFMLTVNSNGLAVSADATLNLKVGGITFFTLGAKGALLINSSGGIAAEIVLTAGAGSAQPGTSDFSLSLTFSLEVNTTGAAVSTINGLTVNLGATDAFGNSSYVDIMGSGHLSLGSLITINGSFTFAAGSTGVEMMINGNVNILGIVFKINVDAGIYSDGIEINAVLTIGTGGSVATFLNGLITVDAQFVFQINTSPTTSNFGVAKKTAFVLQIHGSNGSGDAQVYIFGFQMHGQLSVSISNGKFAASGSLTFNFFGFGDVSIGFLFDSSGDYYFVGQLGVRLGSSSFNIHGNLTVIFASTSEFGQTVNGVTIESNFELRVDGGVTAFGYDFASIGADVQISGSSVDISVYVSVSFYFFSVGGTVHIHLGSLANTPAPPPPHFGDVNGGVLTLAPTESGDDYEITDNGDGTVTLADPSLSTQTQTLSGVTSIDIDLSSYTDSTVTIDGSGSLPVSLKLGGGSNNVTLGNGASTVTGTNGNDTIHGGDGDVTFNAGSGTSVFIGGGAGSTHNTINDPGNVAVIGSGYNFSLVGNSATSATLTYDGNVDTLSGDNITVSLTAATSGSVTFSVSNYSGIATLDDAGNSDVATSIEVDSANLTVNGNTVTESNGITGTITLQSNGSATYGTLELDGGSGANTFAINSWVGGALTLDGKDGSDTYNINFQSSGSFNATVSDLGSTGTDTLVVNGTTGADTIDLSGTAVSLGSQTVNYSGIENMTVYTKANNEIVNITGTSAATTINTGSYTDTINAGNVSDGLNDITTGLTVTGNGTDTLNLDDTGDSGANTGTLTANSLTGVFGSGGSLSYTGIKTFNLNLGSGGDTLNIQETNGTTGTTVTLAGGTNMVNVGSLESDPNGVLTNIKGALTITGAGTTTLNVDDTGDTVAASGTLTGTTLKGLGMGANGITYSGITTLIISLGANGNTFTISDTNKTTDTTLNSGLGKDTVNLTTDSGTTTINGQDSDDTINVSSDGAKTYINGDDGDDTINIQSTGAETDINTGSGANIINIGSAAPDSNGVLDYIQGAINVTGNGSDTMNVDDTGNTSGRNGTASGLLTSTTLTGLGMSGGGITYSGLSTLVISLGSGDDTFNVQSTYSGGTYSTITTLNTGAGTNVVNVTNAGVLTGIAGELIVNGQGTDTMMLDDTADSGSGTLTQTATTLTGLGMGANGILYSSIETLNINLGSHGNTIYIQGNPSITTENLNAGSGTNIISIGSQAQSSIDTDTNSDDANVGDATNTGSVLDNVQGIINITGSGNDTLNVDDSGSTTGINGGLWADKLEFLTPDFLNVTVTVNFSGISDVNISLSEGDDRFAIEDTITNLSTSTAVLIDGNSGDDQFVVFDTHAVTTINGGDGGDDFYNFGNSSVLNLNGDAGDDTFYIYASLVAENTSNVNGGDADTSGNQVYSYRVNAQVNIDGGTGYDKVYIYATVLDDVITIDGTKVTGAGLDVTYTNIEQLEIAGLGGNDTFYIEAITVPTTIIGDGSTVYPDLAELLTGLGLDTDLNGITTGGATATSFNDTFYVGWQGANYIPGSLAGIIAPLTIYGDDGTGVNTGSGTDTIYVDDSADTADQNFTLTSSTLYGSGFGANGLLTYDNETENLDFYLGNGNNTITINGNDTASQTSIYGGRGNDTFIVNDDPLQSPLALFGGLNTFAGDTLTVNGAAAGNNFDITGFTIDGAGATISYEEMEQLTINAGGSTTFNVNGDSIPTYLNGGSGNDTFTVNSNTVSLYLNGNAGNDNYTINANSGMLTATGDSDNDAGNDSFTVNGNSGTLTLNGGANDDFFAINANSGTLTANGNAGNDSFTVNALSSPATINGGAGDDSVTVNTPLAASLTVNGGGDSGDWLTINGAIGNNYVTVASGVVSGLGAPINYNTTNLVINGMAGNDTFQIIGTSPYITRINGGIYGDDIFNVQATTGALYLTGSAIGNNTFNLGSLAPISGGTLANIDGPVFIAGGTNTMRLITLAATGINTVNVDDTGDFAGGVGTLTSCTLTGFGMGAGVTFVSVNTMNINLGPGNDTLNIQSTNSTTVTTLNTGAGANIINIGSNEPLTNGVVSGIQGVLFIIGSGSDTLNVDDTGDVTGQTGTLTATTLTGLGMGSYGITYSGLAALNINLGSGNDTFNIPSTNSTTATTLNTGAGTNIINVGSNEPGTNGVVSEIQGALIIVGSGFDTLNVDDTGDVTGQAGTLTATTLNGLSMGNYGITYSGLAALNINLGSGGNTFTVTGINYFTVTTIDGGAGANSAILNFSGNFDAQELTLLDFATGTLYVGGNFSGLLNFSGTITTATIVGSFTSTGTLNAEAIGTMTVGGDLAGLLNVTDLLDSLTVDGGTPGEIIAGDVHVITVLAGYGNKVLQVIEGGIEREILATPINDGAMPDTVHFAFVYDSTTATNPQLAIRITDTNPIARSFDLALVVTNSSTAEFNLSRIDSYQGGATGVSNVSVSGDLLTQLTAPELQLFTDLTSGSRAGVVLPADNITGVEVSGKLPMGFIDVAGLEGLAFGIVTTASGTPVTVSNPIGSGTSLKNLLGSNAILNPAADEFVVPFNETHSVTLYVHDTTASDLEKVMTLTDQLNDNLPVTAYIQVIPTTTSAKPLVQYVRLVGNGGSINSSLSIANIISGSLGDVTISGSSGATVNNAAGLGNITATSIFGSINVTNAGIYGTIETTAGDIGRATLNSSGQITGVTSIFANGSITATGRIISYGNIVSSIKTNSAFSGVIAAQGDIGVIQRDSNGNAVLTSGALTRFGGISASGNDSGQIIALGNLFCNVTVSGTMTGRIAAEGMAVAGLVQTRLGILGTISVHSFASGSAIISGGLIGDATGKTAVTLGSASGFLAAAGGINLQPTTIASANLLQNQTGSNLAVINAIFTDGNSLLLFDTGGVLNGLTLIETDLANLQDNSGVLSGAIP